MSLEIRPLKGKTLNKAVIGLLNIVKALEYTSDANNHNVVVEIKRRRRWTGFPTEVIAYTGSPLNTFRKAELRRGFLSGTHVVYVSNEAGRQQDSSEALMGAANLISQADFFIDKTKTR